MRLSSSGTGLNTMVSTATKSKFSISKGVCIPAALAQTPAPATLEDMQRKMIAIGGHRGHGTNLATRAEGQLYPSYRENTLKSCKKAVEAGASFVEFDLQVTSDGVVVLWHDDQVIFTGPEGTPVHRKVAELTLAEFKALVCGDKSAEEAESCSQRPTTPLLRRFDGVRGHQAPASLLPWVVSVDDELPTLDAIFNGLPENVALNLEVKMAVPNTYTATPPEEVQRVVGPILECVERHTGMGRTSNRGITFSSFDPDVCVALKQQSSYPIMYLSGMGLYQHADPRRTSIEAAINHAVNAQLAGIVAPASVLLANQGIVSAAKAANLAVLTYGRENNEPENVRQQAWLGVQGAILDEVEHVVRELLIHSEAAAASAYPVQYKVGQLDVSTHLGAAAPVAVRIKA